VQTPSAQGGPAGGSVQYDGFGNVSTPNSASPDESVLCFASDTLLETPNGMRRIHELGVGDRVRTMDSGSKAVSWIKSWTVTARELIGNSNLFPVRITAGALGAGLPKRDLLVSRQHRILISSSFTKRLLGEYEVLIPAIKLTKLKGIYIDTDVDEITYTHIMFDAHEIIYAEGVPSESFLPGPNAIQTLNDIEFAELLALVPSCRAPDAHFPSARRVFDGAEAKRFVCALAENEVSCD